MTKILSLHFGHNSHAVLLNNGEIDSYIQRERISCVKNHAGIDKDVIKKCLIDSKTNISEIEQIIVTNTQYLEFFFEDYEFFNFQYVENNLNKDIDDYFKNNKSQFKWGKEIYNCLIEQ